MRFIFLSFFMLLALARQLTGEAQAKISAYENYIRRYSQLAVRHQEKYHIPASITLAQGLLESGAGQSALARKSNNHFGIKCHADWKGSKVYHDDDKKNECFRKYKNVQESYEDHSLFLTGRTRYAGLFKLDIKNYKDWAKGLQKAGYATDRAYANHLIKLIEDYELYRYDSNKKITDKKDAGDKKEKQKIKPDKQTPFVIKRPVYNTQGLDYVYAGSNDDFDQVAQDTGLTARELQTYNEVPEHFPLQKGDIVYLEKKKRKADKPSYDHVVQIGESMHSISQKYGMRVKNLYKINRKKENYVPVEGDVLKLR
jgi:LysM repeat protein